MCILLIIGFLDYEEKKANQIFNPVYHTEKYACDMDGRENIYPIFRDWLKTDSMKIEEK